GFDAGHGDVTIGGCIGPIERRPTAEGTARCAQTVPGRPCRPCRGLVEDDASDDSADVLIVRILTGPRLCVSTLSGGAAGLELTQAGQGLECGVLAAEDIGDGNGGHGSGNQGRVCGLIGEVVSGDVGAV